MRQVTNSRRSRNRNGRNKAHSSSKQHSFDSNGPDVKVRGSAGQVAEKYLTLARDALTSGDRIAAENYFQHAEHYYRLSNPRQSNDGAKQPSAGDAVNGSQPAQGQPANGSTQAMDRGGNQPSTQPNGQQPPIQPDTQPSTQPVEKADAKPDNGADKASDKAADKAADKATSDEADTKSETPDSGDSAAT